MNTFHVLQHLENRQAEAALALLASEAGDPQNPIRAYQLGWAAVLQEHWDEAFRHLHPLLPPSYQTALADEDRLKQPARQALFWLRLGSTAFALGEVDQALRHLQQSFTFAQPRTTEQHAWLLFEVRRLFARVFLAKENPAEALAHLRYAALYAPEDTEQVTLAQLYEDRAEAFRQLGDIAAMETEHSISTSVLW